MKTELIVTDLTNMHAGRICIAGINPQRQTIRPMFMKQHLTRDWCFQDSKAITPFSIISVNLLRHDPRPPHVEDWIVDEHCLRIIGLLPTENRRDFLESTVYPDVESIFETTVQSKSTKDVYVHSNQGVRSLGTLKPIHMGFFDNTCYESKRDYRITITDQTHHQYRLKIVDLTFQAYVDSLCNLEKSVVNAKINSIFYHRTNYLRIGLARNWGMYPDRCYLQITGIYTFPDYLGGKTFMDFKESELSSAVKAV